MKINNESLINTFLDMKNKIIEEKDGEDKSTSFSQIFEDTLSLQEKEIISEVSNGDTFRKEISENHIFEGGGWAYVDKYGYSHVAGEFKTAEEYKKSDTDVYQYNGRYGGGYGLDKNNNRLRIPIPQEKAFGNDLLEEPDERAKIDDIKNIGMPINYLKYLEIMLDMMEMKQES